MKKLDPRTTDSYFIGYVVNSKEFRFYCPSNSTRIDESINAKILEDSEPSGSVCPQMIEFEETQELTETPLPQGHLIVLKKIQNEYLKPQSITEQSTHEEQVHIEPTQTLPNTEQVELRRSSRIIRPAISSDYIVYLQESDFDVGPKDDPKLFSQAMSGEHSILWFNAIKEEIEYMAKYQV